jgi:hypothetical protein
LYANTSFWEANLLGCVTVLFHSIQSILGKFVFSFNHWNQFIIEFHNHQISSLFFADNFGQISKSFVLSADSLESGVSFHPFHQPGLDW